MYSILDWGFKLTISSAGPKEPPVPVNKTPYLPRLVTPSIDTALLAAEVIFSMLEADSTKQPIEPYILDTILEGLVFWCRWGKFLASICILT